jgi:hypothetical protein
MKRLIPFLFALLAAHPATAERVKDIAEIDGVRDNPLIGDRKSTRLNSSHRYISRMPSSA